MYAWIEIRYVVRICIFYYFNYNVWYYVRIIYNCLFIYLIIHFFQKYLEQMKWNASLKLIQGLLKFDLMMLERDVLFYSQTPFMAT